MKALGVHLVGVLCLLLSTTAVWGEELAYITDQIRIPIRSEKNTTSKVLQFVVVGDRLDLLSSNEDGWSKVRFGEVVGWIVSTYLTDQSRNDTNQVTELKKALLTLEAEHRALEALLNSTNKTIDEAKQANKQLTKENNKIKSEIEFIQKTYEKNIQIEYQSQQLANELVLAKNEIELLKQKNEVNQESSEQIWFILGGLTLLLGLIVGFLLFKATHKRQDRLFR